MRLSFVVVVFLVGCGSGSYGPVEQGDGGEALPDSGALLAPPEAAPVPSCGSGAHGQMSACRATGSPYQFSCPAAPGVGCKMATVGSGAHMTAVYCCALPEYP